MSGAGVALVGLLDLDLDLRCMGFARSAVLFGHTAGWVVDHRVSGVVACFAGDGRRLAVVEAPAVEAVGSEVAWECCLGFD